ncbi:MAG: DKNYY domain-containing protein [Chitinophagales bacterium]
MNKIFFLLVSIFLLIMMGCTAGYEKEGGKWYYNSFSMPNGDQSYLLEGVDNKSFEILDKDEYALDENQVYFCGKVIIEADPSTFQTLDGNTLDFSKDKNNVYIDKTILENADPSTFERLGDSEYSMDENNVYLKNYRLMALDPATFELLDFPYSRDENTVYCGNIPMLVNEPETFKLVKESLGFTSSGKSFFLELNPSMMHCDSMISGDYIYGSIGAYAESEGQFFKDHLEIERPDSLSHL